MRAKSKKGQIANLYSYVLIIAMVAILLGVGLTVLGKLGTTLRGSNDTTTRKAQVAINSTVTGLASITSDWLPVIVVVAVAAIILYLVMRFGGEGKR